MSKTLSRWISLKKFLLNLNCLIFEGKIFEKYIKLKRIGAMILQMAENPSGDLFMN